MQDPFPEGESSTTVYRACSVGARGASNFPPLFFDLLSSISGDIVHRRPTYTDFPCLSLLFYSRLLSLSTLTRSRSLLPLVHPDNQAVLEYGRTAASNIKVSHKDRVLVRRSINNGDNNKEGPLIKIGGAGERPVAAEEIVIPLQLISIIGERITGRNGTWRSLIARVMYIYIYIV